MLTILLFFIVSFGENNIIIDEDGSVDDVIGVIAQFLVKQERIKAITIVPGDSFALPDVWIAKNLVNIFKPANGTPIPLGYSDNAGKHPFPTEWRNLSYKIAKIPFWNNESSLLETDLKTTPSAVSVISKALEESEDGETDILATGPLTNLADVITARPDLKKKIGRVFVMGGAIDVKGNVEGAGLDGSAEWNVYNNPRAFDTVLRSGLNLTLVPLDATRHVPVTLDFHDLIWNFRGQGAQYAIAYEALETVGKYIVKGEYYFWDTLTSFVTVNPSVVTLERMNLRVVLDGPSEGRTVRVAPGDATGEGFPVDVAVSASERVFQETFLSLFNRTWASRLAYLASLEKKKEEEERLKAEGGSGEKAKEVVPQTPRRRRKKRGRKDL